MYTCVWCTEIGVCVGMWYALGYIPVVVGVVYVFTHMWCVGVNMVYNTREGFCGGS